MEAVNRGFFLNVTEKKVFPDKEQILNTLLKNVENMDYILDDCGVIKFRRDNIIYKVVVKKDHGRFVLHCTGIEKCN